jgi:hypothetical protein
MRLRANYYYSLLGKSIISISISLRLIANPGVLNTSESSRLLDWGGVDTPIQILDLDAFTLRLSSFALSKTVDRA